MPEESLLFVLRPPRTHGCHPVIFLRDEDQSIPFSTDFFSIALSPHWIWDLKLDADRPEFSPFTAEGSVDHSLERRPQCQAGATSDTSLPAGRTVSEAQGTKSKSDSD